MYTAWYSARGDGGMHHHQMGQLYHHGPPMIKTEAGVNSDCMMAVDYAPPIKKAGTSSAFVWSGGGVGGGGGQEQAAAQPSAGVGTGSSGGGGAQGLVHWMSVMAEHMGAGGHHDTSHYALPPWNNGAIDHCGQQKDWESAWPRPRNTMAIKQGYEAKMNMGDGSGVMTHHQKTEDRLGHHHHHQAATQMLYGSGVGPARSGSSSSSPVGGGNGGSSGLLVVPQPLGKPPGKLQPLHAHARKYHCKMCPQENPQPHQKSTRTESKMMEGRTIEYRPDGGGLDYHNSPLMAEIPLDNYHIHRSIEHLRSIGGGMLDHHRHLSPNITDLRRYEHPDEIPEVKPSVLRLNEYKNMLDVRGMQNDQENDGGQRQLTHTPHTPHDDGPNNKGYSAPSTPLSENGGHSIPEEKVGGIGGTGTGDRRGRKKHISTSPTEFRAPRGATDPVEWGMLENSDHEVFGSKADLQLHTQIHLREAKPYRCTQCPKAFANSSYLAQHSRIHLGIKPYRCEICQRKFTQLSHLQQHIRTHTGDKPYRCTQVGCTKAFSQLSNLQSHSRCHQTDKPFKCNSCYKCFTHEKDLLEHIPKHKESKHLKTHICQYCGKSYTQETYLSKHMNKHAERADKRPPIAALGLSGLNRSLGAAAPSAVPFGDHPYWPKISPDSAAQMNDESGYPQQRENEEHHEQQLQQQRALFAQHESQEEARSIAQPVSSTANSAFTPINSMAPHLNGLSHHGALPTRPYLYDPLHFQQGKQQPNSFPNQLISLHQIRNYAHQPTTTLLPSDHLLPHSLAHKDK